MCEPTLKAFRFFQLLTNPIVENHCTIATATIDVDKAEKHYKGYACSKEVMCDSQNPLIAVLIDDNTMTILNNGQKTTIHDYKDKLK